MENTHNLPKGFDFETFGNGWMSANARDLCKILFVFGNVNPVDLLKAIPASDRDTVNVRSIESAMARLRQ